MLFNKLLNDAIRQLYGETDVQWGILGVLYVSNFQQWGSTVFTVH